MPSTTSGTIIGNIVYSSWSPKPWAANRADGTFVGSFESLSDAEQAIETTVGRRGRWTQDTRPGGPAGDGIVSWTGRAP